MIERLARTLVDRPPRVIAIGASAGAVEALMQLLPELPADLPVPVLVVVHVPAHRRSSLPQLFERACTLPTREAEDKMRPEPSTVLFAAPDYHLLVEADGSLALSVDEPVHHSRPSIDVLLDSVAEAHGADALGIVLSGASRDGAAGLAHLKTVGAHTWVQSPETAAVAAMPRAALAEAPHVTLDPRAMGRAIATWRKYRG